MKKKMLPIGTDVIIRHDLITSKKYYAEDEKSFAYADRDMLKLKGEKAKIIEYYNSFGSDVAYFLDKDDYGFVWTIDMFVPLKELNRE